MTTDYFLANATEHQSWLVVQQLHYTETVHVYYLLLQNNNHLHQKSINFSFMYCVRIKEASHLVRKKGSIPGNDFMSPTKKLLLHSTLLGKKNSRASGGGVVKIINQEFS